MNRTLAALLALAGLANLVTRCTPSAPSTVPLVEGLYRQDAPRGRVQPMDVSVKAPERWETESDQRNRPYHLLVRLFRWPALEPFDVDPARLVVPPAETMRHVATGEYFFTGLTSARVAVQLQAEASDGPGTPPSGMPPRIVAGKNPVILMRHAISVCDLIEVPAEHQMDPLPIRGVVRDRRTGEAIAGAVLSTPSGLNVTTGPAGEFAVDGSFRVADLFTHRVIADGYRGANFGARFLSRDWARELLKTASVEVELTPLRDPVDISRPLRPLDD